MNMRRHMVVEVNDDAQAFSTHHSGQGCI
jgi:hypothetical protein